MAEKNEGAKAPAKPGEEKKESHLTVSPLTNVILDKVSYPAGKPIDVTSAQYRALLAASSIDDDD